MWLAALGFLRPLAKTVMTVLTFGITIPVGVILAAGLWVHFDKGSTVREAVDRAVQELVSGAELEAERAKTAALELVVSELEGQAEALRAANRRFSENLRMAQVDLENANDEIHELATRPVNNQCVVDQSVFNLLRNR